MNKSQFFFSLTLLAFILGACQENNSEIKKTLNEKKKTTKSIQVKKEKSFKKEKDKGFKMPKLNNKNSRTALLAYGKLNPETIVLVQTRFGDIKIKLYYNTPVHRASFIYLAKNGYYDLTEFHRVVPNMYCQAGNTDDWEATTFLSKLGYYTIEPEIKNDNFHKYGAVSMARLYEKNPQKRSSGHEWFIVLGEKVSDVYLDAAEDQLGLKYKPNQRKEYKTKGGACFLDKDHTVIGEVIEGMDVAVKISQLKVDRREWPINTVPIKVKVLK